MKPTLTLRESIEKGLSDLLKNPKTSEPAERDELRKNLLLAMKWETAKEKQKQPAWGSGFGKGEEEPEDKQTEEEEEREILGTNGNQH